MDKSSNQMRICYLASATVVNTHTHRWINYFAEYGSKVDLITWRAPAYSEIHPDVNVHRLLLPPHYIARYGALLELAWLLKKIRPDIIHAHYLAHFGILAGLYSRIFGFRPIVLTAWGSDVLIDAKAWKKRLIQYALRRADYITCDSEHMVEKLVRLGAKREKIELSYFGTDVRKFKPGPKSQPLIQKLGIADSPIVISLRHLTPLYDVESLVKSIPLVLRAVPQAKFIIAGDGEQREYLESLVKTLGVAASTRFVRWIANNELPQYLNLADIYVSTSLSDGGLAASTAEAMACGLPVVVTDFGDNSEWVKDGVNGFLIPLKNPEALASKIIHLLQNEGDRHKFGQAGRKVIEERNNYEKETGKMEKIYEELVGRYRK